ncbi:MAG: uracil-DNA glycosylase [Fervidicoccaceae archaeon]|jgi:DNA polymerase
MNESEIEKLNEEIITCTKCPLYKYRNKAVPGWGNTKSEIMLVGEAPGREEDAKGIPFVGRAGKLLDEVLKIVGISREKVYITNVVKCRPPANRKPKRNEALSCLPYLIKEILLVEPKIIVLLGSTPATYLFNESIPYSRTPKIKALKEIRGKQGKITIQGKSFISIATFHPAAVLRNPKLRGEFEEDMRNISKILTLNK